MPGKHLLQHHTADASPPGSTGAGWRHRRVGGERLAGAVTGLAALAALAIALAIPAAYFISAYNRLLGVLEVQVHLYGDEAGDAAAQSPELFNAFLGGGKIDLTGLAIATPDDPQTPGQLPERRRVFGVDGHLILEVAPRQPLAWPIVARRRPATQNENRLGEVEVATSFRPQLLATLVIAAGSFTLGGLLLFMLRVIPLRLMHEALDRASYLSAHDQLTGLPNRSLFADRLEQALAAARRAGTNVGMLCLDLDHFKEVNDTLGHAAGDALLRVIAARLRACLRETDTLARLGGDEFAVIQPAARGPHDAEVLAERLIEAVRLPVTLEGQQVFVGLSIGIALCRADVDAGELVKQADMALYRAKAAGRGGYCFFVPEMNASLKRRRALETDLRAALARGELAILYQPQIELATGRIVGAEALMQWTPPGGTAVPPTLFIPVAEETGLIGPMGAWLLRQACSDAVTWPANVQVAVNVSPVQFRLAGFVAMVRGALAETGLDPGRLELEVTEGILLHDADPVLGVLGDLQSLGVRLAMDDFGTGYASLAYLQKFRFDKIKIDRSFVRDLGRDPNAAAIVRALIGLSEALGMATSAEGVESREQAALLRGQGCREVQGFLFWKPLPPEALISLIRSPPASFETDADLTFSGAK